MHCDFCGEEIEGSPFQKEGMNFCSLECSDAMEGGEAIPLGEEILDNPDEYEDESTEDDVDMESDEKSVGISYGDGDAEDDLFDDEH